MKYWLVLLFFPLLSFASTPGGQFCDWLQSNGHVDGNGKVNWVLEEGNSNNVEYPHERSWKFTIEGNCNPSQEMVVTMKKKFHYDQSRSSSFEYYSTKKDKELIVTFDSHPQALVSSFIKEAQKSCEGSSYKNSNKLTDLSLEPTRVDIRKFNPNGSHEMYIDLAFNIEVRGKVYEEPHPDFDYSNKCQGDPRAPTIDIVSQAIVKISLSTLDKKYEVEGNAFDYKSTQSQIKEN